MNRTVAIIGRPNVGKSTLFNALTRTRDALVADEPGVTRDRQYGRFQLDGLPVDLVDTGGMYGDEGALTELMEQQIAMALEEADVLLFMVDARAGLLADDHQVLERIRGLAKPVILLANKAEGLENTLALADFYQLGIQDMISISAAHRKGLLHLQDKLRDFLRLEAGETEAATALDHGPKVAIIGKPNVGKSTLVNRLLRAERVVAYDLPGTTRDSIELPLVWDDKPYTLIDTAGVRRKARVGEGLEKFSILKTIQSIELAHICAVLIDATEGITDQDMHLLGLVVSRAKPVILVVNKWDHLSVEHKAQVKVQLQRKMLAFDWVPLLFISALHGSGLRVLMERVDLLMERASLKLVTNQLTDVLKDAFDAHQPPMVQGKTSQLKYAHSGGNHPLRIVIHGNRTGRLPLSYKKYLENTFRNAFNLKGVPILLQFKDSTNPYEGRKNTLSKRQLNKKNRLQRHIRKSKKKK